MAPSNRSAWITGFARQNSLGEQKQACRLLYSAYGTYVGADIGQFFKASIP
jgi:hypothetical protein